MLVCLATTAEHSQSSDSAARGPRCAPQRLSAPALQRPTPFRARPRWPVMAQPPPGYKAGMGRGFGQQGFNPQNTAGMGTVRISHDFFPRGLHQVHPQLPVFPAAPLLLALVNRRAAAADRPSRPPQSSKSLSRAPSPRPPGRCTQVPPSYSVYAAAQSGFGNANDIPLGASPPHLFRSFSRLFFFTVGAFPCPTTVPFLFAVLMHRNVGACQGVQVQAAAAAAAVAAAAAQAAQVAARGAPEPVSTCPPTGAQALPPPQLSWLTWKLRQPLATT